MMRRAFRGLSYSLCNRMCGTISAFTPDRRYDVTATHVPLAVVLLTEKSLVLPPRYASYFQLDQFCIPLTFFFRVWAGLETKGTSKSSWKIELQIWAYFQTKLFIPPMFFSQYTFSRSYKENLHQKLSTRINSFLKNHLCIYLKGNDTERNSKNFCPQVDPPNCLEGQACWARPTQTFQVHTEAYGQERYSAISLV